jgi:hypothetical protein
MPNAIKIALFLIAVWCGVKMLQKNPDSFVSKLAFSWSGPFPVVGEKRSSFYFRQVRFALGWLIELLLIGATLFVAVWLIPALKEAETFLMVSAFALTIGIGMAILGAILAGLVSAKALFMGPDPEFVLACEPQETNDEEDE